MGSVLIVGRAHYRFKAKTDGAGESLLNSGERRRGRQFRDQTIDPQLSAFNAGGGEEGAGGISAANVALAED